MYPASSRGALFPGSGTGASLLALAAATGPFLPAVLVRVTVPFYPTTGHWSGGYLALMLLIAIVLLLVSRALGTLAWWMSPRMPIYPPLVAGMAGAVLSGWMIVDGSNIARDRSAAVTHDVPLIRIEKGSKNASPTLVTAWDGWEQKFPVSRPEERTWQPGQPLRIVTHAGALGCEYVVSVSAIPPPPRPPPGQPD